jgi:hypothetical protein
VYEPIRWNAHFGWRPMCDTEKQAMFHFWREVGRRMSIKDIPERYEDFEQYNVTYEREHFRFQESNRRVGQATLEMFASWFPGLLRPLVRQAMYALMDDAIITGFGFPRPSPLMRRLVEGGLKLRALALRVWPARRTPHLRTAGRQRSYPKGYRIEELGPA